MNMLYQYGSSLRRLIVVETKERLIIRYVIKPGKVGCFVDVNLNEIPKVMG